MKNYRITGIFLSLSVTYGYAADATVTRIENAVKQLIAKDRSQQDIIVLNEAIIQTMNEQLMLLAAKETALLAEIKYYEDTRKTPSAPRLSALLREFDDQLDTDLDEGQDD